jgi:hypothetical protein
MNGSMKAMPPTFFKENITAIATKFTWIIHTSFEIIRPFFHKAFVILNILLPPLSTILYTNVVKLRLDFRACDEQYKETLNHDNASAEFVITET